MTYVHDFSNTLSALYILQRTIARTACQSIINTHATLAWTGTIYRYTYIVSICHIDEFLTQWIFLACPCSPTDPTRITTTQIALYRVPDIQSFWPCVELTQQVSMDRSSIVFSFHNPLPSPHNYFMHGRRVHLWLHTIAVPIMIELAVLRSAWIRSSSVKYSLIYVLNSNHGQFFLVHLTAWWFLPASRALRCHCHLMRGRSFHPGMPEADFNNNLAWQLYM
jgi:hypothetical protein